MNTSKTRLIVLSGDLYSENTEFSLEQLCQCCAVQMNHIEEFVHEGLLEPRGKDRDHWRFRMSSIRRVKTTVRLQRDLGVNLAGAALALDLLDRITELEKQS
jgi:chaperone modulatory protein CbpM